MGHYVMQLSGCLTVLTNALHMLTVGGLHEGIRQHRQQ